MFYTIEETGLKKIEISQISEEKLVVAFISLQELKESYTKLGFSEFNIKECERNRTYFRTGLDIYDNYSFGIIKIPQVVNMKQQKDILALFLKKNIFIVTSLTDDDGSTEKLFYEGLERYKQNITFEKIVYSVLDKFLLEGNMIIENAQKEIEVLESLIIKNKPNKNTNSILFNLKSKILIQKSYYDQLVSLGEDLLINSNDIFDGENQRYLHIFTDESQRLSDSAQFICDNVMHIRETYEASINDNMNHTMKLFTVLSAIFLPLTLLVGWYGMNFTTMPELTWRYGYVAVIIASIIIALFCYIWFKRKNYFK